MRIDTAERFPFPEVLFRVAEIYAEMSSEETGYAGGARRAAKYYAMIDPELVPEASELAVIMESINSFTDAIDWKELYETLANFESRLLLKSVSPRKVRCLLLVSDILDANSAAFASAGISADDLLKQTLCEAYENAFALKAGKWREASGFFAEEEAEALWLRKRTIRKLAEVYAKNPEMAEEAYRLLAELEEYAASENERYEIRVLAVHAAVGSADSEFVRNAYETFLSMYPGDVKIGMEYCRMLYSWGRTAEARKCLARINETGETDGNPVYLELIERLDGEE